MTSISLIAWIAVFGGGLLAGFIDSIAGGGGLVTLPVLLAIGLPPHLAIGTNKVQSIFGSGTATIRYARGGLVPWKTIRWGVVMSFLFAAVGAWILRYIDASILEKALPFVLAGIWFYVVFKKELGDSARQARIPGKIFYPAAGCTLGLYDGILGPGTGSFWTVSQVSLAGMDLKQATAATKPSNFASNAGALLIFLLTGAAVIPIGLVMAAGQTAGAWLGSHLVMKHKPRFIRPFFLVVVAATVAKLLWDQYGSVLLNSAF